MVRDSQNHQQTNCVYPEQKSKSEPSSPDAAAGFNRWDHDFDDDFGDPFGYNLLDHDIPERMREMLRNNQCDFPRLEDMFHQMAFHDTRPGDSGPEDPLFGVRLRTPVDDPPPPYPYDDNVANDRHVTLDDVDNDDEGKTV